MNRIYVGCKGVFRSTFRSKDTPTEQTHGKRFNCVIGPFRTVRGAKAMVHYGYSNPHMPDVASAERIGKKYAEELRHLRGDNERL